MSSDVSRAYLEGLRQANAVVHVQDPPPLAQGAAGYYKDCLLKLLAFKMHVLAPGLERVLVLDSDQLIMKSMDALVCPPMSRTPPENYETFADRFSL